MKLKNKIGYLIQRFHFILEFLKNRATENKFLRFAFKIVAPHLIDYEYPINFNIETTNACNLGCQMCPRKESNRPVGYLSMDLCKKIVDEARMYGSRGFSLHKDGEPLLHRDLFKIIEYIKKSNPRNTIYLTTNGVFLDEERALEILKSGVDRFNISVGAARKETFEKIKGCDDLGKIEENVRNFIKLKEDGGYKTEVSVQIIKMRETIAEIGEFKNKWKKYPVKINTWNFLNWGGAKEDNIGDNAASGVRYPCYALWFSPAINWDGKVSLCCMDWDEKLIIGDINNQSLAEIWQGEKLENYRRLHLRGEYGKIPVCNKCNYWSWWPDIFFGKYKK